jgi:acyl-CoA hydrolase
MAATNCRLPDWQQFGAEVRLWRISNDGRSGMDLKKACPDKVVDAETAISKIKNGSRVFIGTGCGEPQHLIRTMVEDLNMQDIMVYQMLSWTFADYVDDPRFLRRFSLKLFFISSSMRKAAFEGKIDYIPTYLSQIP